MVGSRMLKRLGLVVALGTLFGFYSTVTAEEAKGEKVTLKGEILDLHCYLTMDGKGPDHANCAKGCINKGLPAGLLADGKVYLLLGAGHDSAKTAVAEHGGKEVTVQGTLIDRNGFKAIQIEKVTP